MNRGGSTYMGNNRGNYSKKRGNSSVMTTPVYQEVPNYVNGPQQLFSTQDYMTSFGNGIPNNPYAIYTGNPQAYQTAPTSVFYGYNTPSPYHPPAASRDPKDKYLSTIIPNQQGKRGTASNRGGYPNTGAFKKNGATNGGGYKGSAPKKPSQPEAVFTKYACELCKISCVDDRSLKAHMVGKAHKKRTEVVNKEVAPSLLAGKSTHKCDVCDVLCSNKDALKSHVSGKLHEKKVAMLKKLGQTIPVVVFDPINGTSEVESGKVANESKAPKEGKIVGEEYVIQDRNPTTDRQIEYYCKICECKVSDAAARLDHLKGKRHLASYKMIVDPSIVTDNSVTSSMKKVKKGKMVNGGGMSMAYPPSETYANYQQEVARREYSQMCISEGDPHRLSQEEEMLLNKEVELEPAPQQFQDIHHFMCCLEQAIGAIYGMPPSIDKPLIVDFLKIGLVKMELFSYYDKDFELAILLSDYPTLKNVEWLSKHLENFLRSTYDSIEVCCNPKNGGITIKIERYTYEMYVTSGQCRRVDPSQASSNELVVPLEKCLIPLAYLRHDHWFEIKYKANPVFCLVVKIIRNIAQNVVGWELFKTNKWLLLLLVDAATELCGIYVTPYALFYKFLQLISSGFLQTKNLTLKDPCEKGETDLLKDLSQEFKEYLTMSIQHAIRLVAFGQLGYVIFYGQAYQDESCGEEKIAVPGDENVVIKPKEELILESDESGKPDTVVTELRESSPEIKQSLTTPSTPQQLPIEIRLENALKRSNTAPLESLNSGKKVCQ
uniref:DZF domain-containing protein n=1 Tax=Rhabditophanes sp. KR3021 TaxID=114890 RepID=A0AC35TU96_9BILA